MSKMHGLWWWHKAKNTVCKYRGIYGDVFWGDEVIHSMRFVDGYVNKPAKFEFIHKCAKRYVNIYHKGKITAKNWNLLIYSFSKRGFSRQSIDCLLINSNKLIRSNKYLVFVDGWMMPCLPKHKYLIDDKCLFFDGEYGYLDWLKNNSCTFCGNVTHDEQFNRYQLLVRVGEKKTDLLFSDDEINNILNDKGKSSLCKQHFDELSKIINTAIETNKTKVLFKQIKTDIKEMK